MKYCPNTTCAFLVEIGTVAEYEDAVQACLECDTPLVAGTAPPLVAPTATNERQPSDTTLQTVVRVETFSEAYAIKNELETMRIAAKIVMNESNEPDSDFDSSISPEIAPLFDLLVQPHHAVPAMDIIETLFFEQESESGEFYEDDVYGANTDERFSEDEWVAEGLDLGSDVEGSALHQATGMGNKLLLTVLLGILLLAIAALVYGFTVL